MNLATGAELAAIGSGVGAVAMWVARGGHWIGTLKSHLDRLDTGQTALGERLGKIEAQLKPNGGESLHDQVRAVAEHKRQDQTSADLAHALAMVLERRQDQPAAPPGP